ncbi:MAG: hypothetical protein AAF235_05015 [Planctomycetota bacterium]
MKINCISCGHGFGVDDSYADYEGLLRCATCAFLLDVKIEDGMIRAVRPGSLEAALPPQPATQQATPQATPQATQAAPQPAMPAPMIHFPVSGNVGQDDALTIAQNTLNIAQDTLSTAQNASAPQPSPQPTVQPVATQASGTQQVATDNAN